MSQDLTTLIHEELSDLYQTLRDEWDDNRDQPITRLNIEHRMSQVRAQIAKVKPKAEKVEKPAEQPKLF